MVRVRRPLCTRGGLSAPVTTIMISDFLRAASFWTFLLTSCSLSDKITPHIRSGSEHHPTLGQRARSPRLLDDGSLHGLFATQSRPKQSNLDGGLDVRRRGAIG